MDLLYYAYLDYILRTVGRKARSILDVGTAGCPYLETYDWIDHRVSMDLHNPYSSDNVTGITTDFVSHDFGNSRFDVVTCLQVLEHVRDVTPFARKLLEVGDIVIISIPYKWPRSAAADHIHDPIGYSKLSNWMGRASNYHQIVHEPFRGKVGRRLIAVYDRDPTVGYGRKDFKDRIRRGRDWSPTTSHPEG